MIMKARTPSKAKAERNTEIDKKASKKSTRAKRTVTSLRHTQRAGSIRELVRDKGVLPL